MGYFYLARCIYTRNLGTMRKTLKKTELTFAFKIGILFSMILFASSLKDNNKIKNANTLVQNIAIDIPAAVFANF